MGFVRFAGNVAAGIEDLKASISGPGEARRRAEEAARAKDAREREDANFGRKEDQRGIQVRNDSRNALATLGADTQVANAAQGVINSGNAFNSDLRVQELDAQGAQTRQTVDSVADSQIRYQGAKTTNEINRDNNFVDVIVPGVQAGLIAPQHKQDLAIIDRFVGQTPMMENLMTMQREDRAMQREALDAERTDPRQWGDLALKAAAAGMLFL